MSFMHDTLQRIAFSGYLDPQEAIETAVRLINTEGTAEAVDMGVALLRQTMTFSPYIEGLAPQLRQTAALAAPAPSFLDWFAHAETRLAQLPAPKGLAPPNEHDEPQRWAEFALNETDLEQRLPATLHLWRLQEKELFLRCGEALLNTPAGTITAPLLAWGAYGAGEAETARQWLGYAPMNQLAMNLSARLLMDDGRLDEARSQLRQSLTFDPLQLHIVELLAELDHHPPPNLSQDHSVHICLYSWNKLDTLLDTLRSLATTNIAGAKVTLLNNGSDAYTPEQLEQAASLAAPGLPLSFIHLPVNIGAPGARNWLLHLPEVAEADYVAFLDDDVLLPPNWLDCGLETLLRHPEAVVAGPRGLGAGSMATVQYVYRYFSQSKGQTIRFTPNAPTVMDLGQFSSPRPSLTVMGCCHVFNNQLMRRLGVLDFDIRYSPSQVDDIDHDLQIWLHGGQVMYDGRMNVVHLQDTGKAPTEQQRGHTWANHFKMEYKFSEADLARITSRVDQAGAAHWQRCLKTAWNDLPQQSRKLFSLFT